jgi:SSS family solute:Na+ symporter
VILGLYTGRLNPWALLAGWAAGIGSGVWMFAQTGYKVTTYVIHVFGLGIPCYAALSSLVANLAISVALSWAFNAVLRTPPSDATMEADYV